MHILLTFFLAVSWGVPATPVAHGDGTTYATGLAENRLIPFLDAAQLRMDALTDLLIKESPDRRTVYLTEGQIQASVQHGKAKPLDVIVHGILLRDLGTEFNVAAHGDVVTVSVTMGKLQVMELHSDGSQANPINIKEKNASRSPTYLLPGDLARLESHDQTVLITRLDNNLEEARNRSSWIEGRLKTSGQRLDEVLWEINSRNKVHLLIGDSVLAQMSIGGNYDLMRVDEFLQTTHLLGIDVVPVNMPGKGDTPTYILRLPAEEPAPRQAHK
jgi:ferric-dicitrate binding protein FerR (iron transport regulator)